MAGNYIIQYDTSNGKITDWWITFDQPRGLSDNEITISKEEIDSKDMSSISELEVDTENKKVIKPQKSYYGSVASLKNKRIDDVKSKCFETLSKTDWYITREQETGQPIPQEILNYRSEIRSKSNAFESDIRDLDTIDAVLEYEFSLPDPPN